MYGIKHKFSNFGHLLFRIQLQNDNKKRFDKVKTEIMFVIVWCFSRYLWLHVRGVGEWTNRLYAYFEKEQERLHATEAPASAAILPGLITENAGNRTGGVTNPSFVGDSNLTLAETGNPGSTESVPVAGDGISLANKPGGGPLANPGKLPLLLLARKQPLSKSLSMPDVNTKMKNRQRLLA